MSTTGRDSNSCIQTSPCKTINGVDSRLGGSLTLGSNGTVIHVASGTYSGAIVTNKNSTASARIRYISDTQYGARLIGAASGSNQIWISHGKYTDVVGFDFDGSVNANVHQGIITYWVDLPHNWILRNKIHDTAKNGGAFNETGSIGSCAYNGTVLTQDCADIIEGNLLYHNNGGRSGSTISNGDGGIDLGLGDIAINNIVMDQGEGYGIQASHSSKHVIITNNTIINNAVQGIILATDFGGINDFSTVNNNIIVNNGGVAIRIYPGGCGSNNIYTNNLLYGNQADWTTSSCPTNMLTNIFRGSNSTTFVNYTGTVSGDYHLKAGSTAIDNGTTACATSGCVPSTDFSGRSRPQGAAIDIGAYEQ